jgi:hypothetical protein
MLARLHLNCSAKTRSGSVEARISTTSSQFRLRVFFPEQSGRIATADHLQVAIRPLVPVLRL